MSTIWIEQCRTPIYERIAHALGRELAAAGHQVMVVKPTGFDGRSFGAFLGELKDGLYLSTNENNALQMLAPDGARHYFEIYGGRIVFVHQDSVLARGDHVGVLNKLQSFQRVAARSVHLCIEPGNVELLRSLGIAAQLVGHATETMARPPWTAGFLREAAFIGHVVPDTAQAPTLAEPLHSRIRALAEARAADASLALESGLQALSEQALPWFSSPQDRPLQAAAHRLWLRGQLHAHSLSMRGRLLEAAALDDLTIFGGDPAYLHGVTRNLELQRPGIRHEPAAYDAQTLQRLHAGTAVSLNITALQFDHAVINRFHDVVMAGGLCLTDAKSLLPELTRHHAEVAYSTPAELRDRVRHFAAPQRAQERALLVREMQREIAERGTTARLAMDVLLAARGL